MSLGRGDWLAGQIGADGIVLGTVWASTGQRGPTKAGSRTIALVRLGQVYARYTAVRGGTVPAGAGTTVGIGGAHAWRAGFGLCSAGKHGG